jgi:hypothetical protein
VIDEDKGGVDIIASFLAQYPKVAGLPHKVGDGFIARTVADVRQTLARYSDGGFGRIPG